MRWLADLAYLIAVLIYLPIALYQIVFLGKNRTGWRERFGAVPRFDPQRRRIWIHAVSLGETNATPKLVAGLRERLPDVDIVFSSTTDTGCARACELYGSDRVFRFPLDFSFSIGRVLDRVRPTMIVLVELEVWFNLTNMAHARGISVVVVNGRLTERSAKRFTMIRRLASSMFRRLAWVGAQDGPIATRFAELGVPPDRISVTGSVKWDTAMVADSVPGTRQLAEEVGLSGERPVWVCGSTGPGEEEKILRAYRIILDRWNQLARDMHGNSQIDNATTHPVLVIVPRKPERFDEVAAIIADAGVRCVRRSRSEKLSTEGGNETLTVLLGDTIGELRKFYSLADVVFVGRSLVPMGGSDPMEVAALGKPIVAGPHMDNFRQPCGALSQAGALKTVERVESLADEIFPLLADCRRAAKVGELGQDIVRQNQGATLRTVDRLVELMGRTKP